MGTTRTIGLTVADITNPFFTDVVSVIQEVLHRAGYAVMLCCNDEDIETQDDQIQLLLDRMVDGLIIAPAGDDANLKRILEGTNVPVVLIDRICDGVDTDAVDPRQPARGVRRDNLHGASRASAHRLHFRLARHLDGARPPGRLS